MPERTTGAERRRRLRQARLYFVTDALDAGPLLRELLRGALEGGADMLQLRDKAAGDSELLRAAEIFGAACHEAGALFWLNDRPDLVERVGADGVHVGQHDEPVERVRAEVGPDALVGLSTHTPAQLDAALQSEEADQLSVGPVHATPTKEGRPAAGLDYVRYAATHAGDRPWFAIGGIDAATIGEVVAAGARRVVVVRAIRDAPDPGTAAAQLRAALEGRAAHAVG
jgi:thiamine-phosphate pyrophosphorylase